MGKPLTAETRDVPNGIDPGWEMNPGAIRARHVERLLQDKLMAAPRDIQKTALRDIAMSDHVARLATQDLPGNAPIGILPAELRGHNLAPTPVVEFSAATRQHVFEEHPERRVSDLRFLADLDEAPRVALQERPGEARRLIFELDAGDSSSAARQIGMIGCPCGSSWSPSLPAHLSTRYFGRSLIVGTG